MAGVEDRRVQCRDCMKRVPWYRASTAGRTGGGSYNRAPRHYSSTICLDCIVSLLSHATTGHRSVHGWFISSLTLAKTQIEAQIEKHAPPTKN